MASLPTPLALSTPTYFQVCVAQTRLIVANSIKEELLRRLAAELEQLEFATDPLALDPAAVAGNRHRPLGPIVTAAQYQKVIGFIAGAGSEGAKLVTGGTGRCVALFRAYSRAYNPHTRASPADARWL